MDLKCLVVRFIAILGFACTGNPIIDCLFIRCVISNQTGIHEVNNDLFNNHNICTVTINCSVYRMECIFTVYVHKWCNISDR